MIIFTKLGFSFLQIGEFALKEASKLPTQEQEALPEWILAELASEKRWEEAFAKSDGTLSKLLDEALAEFHSGI